MRVPDPRRLADIQALIDASGLESDHWLIRLITFRLRCGRDQGFEHLLNKLKEVAQERQARGAGPFSVLSQSESGVSLGITTDLVREGADLTILPSTLARHAGVWGLTGTGKSWFLADLALQLARQDIPTWIFDRSRDFRRITTKPGSGSIRYLRPEWLEWNVLQAPQDPASWKHRLVGLLSSSFYGRGGGEMVLAASLDALYQERGCYQGSQNWPTLEEWWTRLSTTQPSFRTREAGYHESALRVLHAVRDGLPGTFQARRSIPFDVLAKTSFVLDVSDLNVPSYLFLMMVLLEQTTAGQYAQQLQRCVIIDEASECFNANQVRRQEHGYPPQHDLPRRFRGRGVGLIAADQSPNLLPEDIHGNLGTVVAFRLLNSGCIRTVASAGSLSKEQAALLPVLPAQHAIVQSVDLAKPFLVRMPERELPNPPSLEDLMALREDMLEGLVITEAQAPEATATSTAQSSQVPSTDIADSQGVTDQPSASPQGEGSTKDILSADDYRYLERLAMFPQEQISERCEGLRLPRMDEWNTRTRLIQLGYACLSGKIQRIQLFRLTEKGIALMRTRGINVESHKGGVFHLSIVRLIEEDVARRYSDLHTTRGGQFNGVQPDLIITATMGACLAVQVCVSNSAEYEKNSALRLAELDAITRVVVVCTTQAKVKAVQRALAGAVAQHEESMFGTPGSGAKVTVLHGEELLQQRLDWLELCKPKAASQGHPDQAEGVLDGEAAEAGGNEVESGSQGEEGSSGLRGHGSKGMTGGPGTAAKLPEWTEDGTGGEALDEPEGLDEAVEAVQGLQEPAKAEGDLEASQGAARPGGRAGGDGRGQGTETGIDQGKNRGRGSGPEPEAREGADQGDRPEKPDDRKGGRRKGTEQGTAGAEKANRGKVSSVKDCQGARTGAIVSGINLPPEAGIRAPQGGGRRSGRTTPDDDDATRRADVVKDDQGERVSVDKAERIRPIGCTNKDADERTTLRDENDSEAKAVKEGKIEHRRINLKTEIQVSSEDRLLITFKEAAMLCSVSQKTISRAVKAGYLQGIQAPGTRGTKGRRISRAELDAWQGRQALEAEKARAAVRATRDPSGGQ